MLEETVVSDLNVAEDSDTVFTKKKNLTAAISVIKQQETDKSQVQIRKNFSETAFFFPDLRTDSSGAIEFSFTIPEALTKWKFQALPHNKDLVFGYNNQEIVTQKNLK